MKEKSASSTKHTFLVMIFTFISRILGFVRQAVFAYIFGAGTISDVINLTFAVPNNLRKLMAEGGLSSAFIPVFNKNLVDDPSGKKTQHLFSRVFSFQLVVIIPLCVLCVLFARPLVSIVISEFKTSEEINLSSELFKWFIFYLPLISISAIIMGILNTHKIFSIPAVTPVLFSICVIFSLLFFYRYLGPYAMVLGVLLGGLAQIIFQLPQFIKENYRIRFNFNFFDNDFIQVIKRWLPVMTISSVFTITQVIALRFASGLPETGSVTYLTNAIVIFQLPYGLFFASVSTVLFPKMSKQFAMNDKSGLRDTLQYGIRFLLVLLIPSMAVLILLGNELIAVIYQAGNWQLHDTIKTGQVLLYYSTGLFSVAGFNFLTRFFYSSNNYRIPFIAAVIVGVIDVVLSLILKETVLRVSGLALANSIAFFVGIIFLLIFARKKAGGLNLKKIGITIIKISVSIVFLIAFLLLSGILFKEYWMEGRSLISLLILGGKGIAAAGMMIIIYRLLKVEMFRRKNE